MQILMKHPKEGQKLVYSDDIEKHKAAGWMAATDTFVVIDGVVEQGDPEPKKRGRPFKVVS